MVIKVTFDNGTVMKLENVLTMGFDAHDSTFQETNLVSPPDFIRKKIDVINAENNN